MFDKINPCKHRFAKEDGNRKGNVMERNYNGFNSGIDVLSCVQGNTVRAGDPFVRDTWMETDKRCVVYAFKSSSSAREAAAARKRALARKKAARDRARRVTTLRMLCFGALLVMMFSIGGIASRAQSRKVPDAYKYYDTITVGYQENLLDIVQRYDDRNYYETQRDYVRELCRINNLEFDETEYPEIAPGTHLVVPYYSTELK